MQNVKISHSSPFHCLNFCILVVLPFMAVLWSHAHKFFSIMLGQIPHFPSTSDKFACRRVVHFQYSIIELAVFQATI